MKKWLPWFITALFAAWVLCSLLPPREKGGFQTREFGKLPVLLNGRVQPLDSVARNSLLMIHSRQSVTLEGGQTFTATEWLLEVMMKPEVADRRKLFRVDNLELLALLRLPENEKYFSFSQILPQVDELENQNKRINAIDPPLRTAFEKQAAKLFEVLALYHRLKNSLQPEGTEDFTAELNQYVKVIGSGVAAAHDKQAGKNYDEAAVNKIMNFLSLYKFMADVAYPLMIPPLHPEQSRDAWSSVGTSLMESARNSEIHPAVQYYAAMSTAYRHEQPPEFNRAATNYRQWLSGKFSPELGKGDREFFFNEFQPFYKSMVIYLAAFLLACAFWFNLSPWLQRSAFSLVILALILHTGGLIFRMILEHRPPVTNLYSSAIFIGWGAVILGVILERLSKDGIGSVTASCIGFSTLVIAHNLALGGDTMEMLRAVLDTNFWLATHVVTVTVGYASTFVAGFLAALYILRGALTRSLSEATAKSLVRMVYGVVCFATLFSFVGTILGGIWADQSWGRFWGWDPKENGALLIVLWNAAYLHARWGKVFPERGLMGMAVFGNIVTSFSWFGVNMLGIGLHSYGFMDQSFKWLILFDISQAILVAFALVPQRYWLSFRAHTKPPMPMASS